MIRSVHGVDLFNCPDLAVSMFEDRKYQFHDRLKWQVTIEDGRLERDQYDAINPMYIILERDDGSHGGSMRLIAGFFALMATLIVGSFWGLSYIPMSQFR